MKIERNELHIKIHKVSRLKMLKMKNLIDQSDYVKILLWELA